MLYFIEERSDGYAVIGKGNDRAADVGMTAIQANKRAHELAGEDGWVDWKDLRGRFEKSCVCARCKKNRP